MQLCKPNHLVSYGCINIWEYNRIANNYLLQFVCPLVGGIVTMEINGNQSYSKKHVHYEELEQYYPDLIIRTHRLIFHTYFTCIYIGRNGSSSYAWMTIHIFGCCTWRYAMMPQLDAPSHLGLL